MATKRDGLEATVHKGDLRTSLEALRDVLAASIAAADPDKRAALARQLRDVLKDLAGMAKPEGSALDEIAKRRADRQQTKVEDGTDGRVGRSGPGSGRTRAGRRAGS